MNARMERAETSIQKMKESGSIKEGNEAQGPAGGHLLATQNKQEVMDMSAVLQELNDKKKRENNIVVYNVPESNSNMFQERINHDRQIIRKLLSTCKVQEDKMIRVLRLGRKIEGRDRPVLAVLTDSEVRNYLFQNLKELGKDDNLKNFSDL